MIHHQSLECQLILQQFLLKGLVELFNYTSTLAPISYIDNLLNQILICKTQIVKLKSQIG
jgi:hypothetical protein